VSQSGVYDVIRLDQPVAVLVDKEGRVIRSPETEAEIAALRSRIAQLEALMNERSGSNNDSADIIRAAAHRLLDEYMDANVAFRAECDRAKKYVHESENLNQAIRLHAAVDSLSHAYAAVKNGHNAVEQLRKYISRECAPSCGPVSAADILGVVRKEIEAVKTEGT
jgi:hypothetical protein